MQHSNMNAIIYGPDDAACSEDNEREVKRVRAYGRRRRYEVVAYTSMLSIALSALKDGAAQVVLFARTDWGGARVERRLTASQVMAMPGFSYALIRGSAASHMTWPGAPAAEAGYETARLLPRGDDGGFAEAFLDKIRRRRHAGDT